MGDSGTGGITEWLRNMNISLDMALKKDKDLRMAAEKDLCWFHENTSRNLAEHKLKEGKPISKL